ncbi:MAG: 6-bladed beta-propeller [Acidobacteriota bacterium]|nr:6-bladed beta-propeller [Acidobacteriota bacterium]
MTSRSSTFGKGFRPSCLRTIHLIVLVSVLVAVAASDVAAKERKKKKAATEDPYAAYVWPPPPDTGRIKLEAIISGRADVEAKGSSWKKRLIGASPGERYDRLAKPWGVAFDPQGRLLVTDQENRALIRFDRTGARMDVFGTRTTIRLHEPMGLTVSGDGTIFVADGLEQKVLAFDSDGELVAWYGQDGELVSPTDVAVSPDGTKLYVADARAHRVAIFDRTSRKLLTTFGSQGNREGEFAFPTSLGFGPDGDLFVLDQLNARIQVLSPDGEYVDEFGGRGVGFGNFVRPKDIAVDEAGLIYVTDFSFNNFQLFDADFSLLTFIGTGGREPGQFEGASGIDVKGDRIAVVDQLGRRVEIFRFIVPKTAGPARGDS